MTQKANLRKIFETKESAVIVVHPTSAIRGQITTILKELGFHNLSGATDISEVVQMLSEGVKTSSLPGWIITPLFAASDANALQLGQLFQQKPELESIAYSLLTTNEESYVLPFALERGLLTWSPAEHFNQGDSIRKEIQSILTTVARLDYEADIVSLFYTGLLLRASNSPEALLKLTTAMLELKPGNAEILFSYANALALSNKTDEAKRTATQAVWSDKSLILRLGDLKDSGKNPIFSADEIKTLESSSSSVLNAFGLSNCVIIDPDSSSRNHVRKALESLGIQNVQEFEDGQSAWDFIKDNHANTIVISEWKLPKLSGMALMQRMHQAAIHDVPFIISSAQLGPQDRGLLEELGTAVLLEKPLSLDSLENNIKIAVKEEHLPSSFMGVIRKVRGLMRQNKFKPAKKLWAEASTKMLIPMVYRKITAAELLYGEAKLEEAYADAQAAATLGAKGAYFFNLLGKITFSLGDFDGAAAWFDRANKEVSINIDRLADMAVVELHRGDVEKADEITAKAAKVDAGSTKVAETQAMVAIEKGNAKEAAEIMAQLGDMMNIVAHLNNRAVAMAWKGDHDKGISLYEEALAAAPKRTEDEKQPFSPSVTYNLALALARKGDLNGAQKALSGIDPDALATFDSRLSAKISRFKTRVKEAVDTGVALEIETPKTSDTSKKKILNLAKIADMAASKVGSLLKELKISDTIDYRAIKMAEKPLYFKPKKS